MMQEVTVGCSEYPETLITIQGDPKNHRMLCVDEIMQIAIEKYFIKNEISKKHLFAIMNEIRKKLFNNESLSDSQLEKFMPTWEKISENIKLR